MDEQIWDVSGLGPQGDGLCGGPQGRVFVAGAAPGDRLVLKVRREDTLKRGEIVRLVEPSPHRQAPPCPHFDLCGNCTLQHLRPEYYRHWKTELVHNALEQQGLRPSRWLPPQFLSGPRRRLTLTARKEGKAVVLGYYRRRSQALVNIEQCGVVDPTLWALKPALSALVADHLLPGKALDLFLQKVGGAVELVFTGPALDAAALIRRLEKDPALTSIVRAFGRPHPKAPLDRLFQRGALVANFGLLSVALPPGAFLQPTLEGQKALQGAVESALPHSGRWADLFSGCGTFGGTLLSRGTVEAFESSPSMVRALERAARGLPLSVQERDLFRRPLTPAECRRFDGIVFDPPRAGCPEQAATLARSKVPTLVGISCNPATFARDAKILCDGGYRLRSVQVIDQFLWSHHVEVVGVFGRA